MRRNCPQRPRVKNNGSSPKLGKQTFSQSKNSGKDPAHKTTTVGVYKLSANTGMFVKAKVSVFVNLLTDTGATITIGNTMLYRQRCQMLDCLHHKDNNKLLLPIESLYKSWVKLLPVLNLKMFSAQTSL